MRTRSVLGAALAAGAALLVLSGCTGEKVSVEGTWGTGGAGKPQLVLEEGGVVSGTDGCNRLVGSWSRQDERTIRFSGIGSTMMACPDVDAWLAGMHTGELDGGVLRIRDDDGSEIGTLSRASSG